MTQPESKGHSTHPAELKPAALTRRPKHHITKQSSSTDEAEKSDAITLWLGERPKQEYWHPLARIGNARPGPKV
jgi:hypothetical protein